MIEYFMKALNIQGHAEPFKETEFATLWRVRSVDSLFIVKHFKPGVFKDEHYGLQYLQAKEPSQGVVTVREIKEDLCVMDYLQGPTLGEIARDGDLLGADHILAQLAKTLLDTDEPQINLPGFAEWHKDLFDLRFAPDCSESLKKDMQRAQHLAAMHLETCGPLVALHGDLHHDNVIQTMSGPKAIDAKGVMAPRAYEVSNALRNPEGLDHLLADHDLQTQRIALFADAIGCSEIEVATWGAIRAALSIAWRSQGILGTDPDAPILATLLEICRGLHAGDPGRDPGSL